MQLNQLAHMKQPKKNHNIHEKMKNERSSFVILGDTEGNLQVNLDPGLSIISWVENDAGQVSKSQFPKIAKSFGMSIFPPR